MPNVTKSHSWTMDEAHKNRNLTHGGSNVRHKEANTELFIFLSDVSSNLHTDFNVAVLDLNVNKFRVAVMMILWKD